MREKTKILFLTLIFGYLVLCFTDPVVVENHATIETVKIEEDTIESFSIDDYEPVEKLDLIYFQEPEENIFERWIIEYQPKTKEPVIKEKEVSEEDIELLALLTMAEAEGECEEGKRLVIDTVLNRVDSIHFPDTIYDVIYQPTHFSSMWNGRVKRCKVLDEIIFLVKEELDSRTNSDVIYFNAGHYSKYGEPMFSVGKHYFSSYD